MKDYNLEKIQDCCNKLYYFDTVASTNKAALMQDDAPDRSVFLAKEQTNGRGRLGRNWESNGDGIFMTILLKPTEFQQNFSALTLVCGLAVSRVMENSKIKWPNDIVLRDKKVCGILVEGNFMANKTPNIAVGIGINVNNKSFSGELANKATSLYLHTNKEHNKTEIAVAVLKEFFLLYDEFANNGFSEIKKEYLQKSATIGKEILVLKNGEEIKGTAVDIAENGELKVDIDGEIKSFNAGEISVRGLLGYN